MKPRWWQGSLFYLLLLVAILALAFSFLPTSNKPKDVDFYAFIEEAKQGNIDTIQQQGNTIIGLKDDKKVIESSFVGSTKELMDTLKESGITLDEGGIKFSVKAGGFDWGSLLISFIPLLLFGVLLFFLFRSARGANTQAFNFIKSRARLAAANKPTVTFADVAGVDEAKGELQEIGLLARFPPRPFGCAHQSRFLSPSEIRCLGVTLYLNRKP